MNVTVEAMPEYRVAAVHHVGPYDRISEAYARLDDIAGAAGLLRFPECTMVGIYYNNPQITPADQLQSDAGVTIPEGVALPDGLLEKSIPARRDAHTSHIGPYSLLGKVWSRFMGEWLPRSGHTMGDGLTYEVYRNNPSDTPPERLHTELYLPIA